MRSGFSTALRTSVILTLSTCAWAQTTEMISRGVAGAPKSGGPPNYQGAWNPCVSGDGRYVAFHCSATNLTRDANRWVDAFLRDVHMGVTEIVSVSTAGVQAMRRSNPCDVSYDGRFVLFETQAANLVPGDANASNDLFLRDRAAHTTELISVSSSGTQGNASSSDARMTPDARVIVFLSFASTLVGGDTNGEVDVFVRDRQLGLTERVSVDSAGNQGNGRSGQFGYVSWVSISQDGRFVAFTSRATNLVPGDTNGVDDVFVRDRQLGQTRRVSVSSAGVQGNAVSDYPSLTGDGRFVCFNSSAANLVTGDTNGARDVFVHDIQSGTTERVSLNHLGQQASGDYGRISADGRVVVLTSGSPDMVPGPTNGQAHIYARDLASGSVDRVSVSTTGELANAAVGGYAVSVSSDGRFVAFPSHANNLAPSDLDTTADVFLRDRLGSTPPVMSYCTAKPNSAGCTPRITSVGTPSASVGGFRIGAEQVLEDHVGLLFYGVVGPHVALLDGGYLCLKAPLRRTPPQVAAGTGLPPCTGIYDFDYFQQIASGGDPALFAGQHVWSQYWTRDPASQGGTGLTDALTFGIHP